MASSDSQIDKPQRGRPKRAELPDANINTGAQSINTESFFNNKNTQSKTQAKLHSPKQFTFQFLHTEQPSIS